MKKIFLLFGCLTLLALMVSCSDDKVAGISTVETENASLIKVVFKDSTPATFARVKLSTLSFPDTLNADVRECLTDSLGYFRIEKSDTNIAVEILDNGEGVFENIGYNDSIKGRKLVMDAIGSVDGSVNLPVGKNFAWIQVFGTDHVVKTDSLGHFKIDSLAPADYKFKAIAGEASAEFEVSVKTGEKAEFQNIADLRTWPNSKQFKASELVSEWMPQATPTVGFVRLDTTNFDFSTSENGQDIWFASENGNIFESEIAYWDSAAKRAVLRVRLQNLEQTVNMFWGNSDSLHTDSKNIWKGLADSVYKKLYILDLVDFESGKHSNLELPAMPSEWYFSHAGDSVKSKPTVDHYEDSIVTAGYGREGHAFHWISDSPKDSWAFFGVWFCSEKIECNFAGLDSIEFYIRGTGSYSFAFESIRDKSSKGRASYLDTLKDNEKWIRKVLTPSNFMEADGKWDNLGFDAIRNDVTSIAISAYGKAEFWIDDIKIYGINLDDLR